MPPPPTTVSLSSGYVYSRLIFLASSNPKVKTQGLTCWVGGFPDGKQFLKIISVDHQWPMCLPRTVQKSKQKAETPGPCLPSAALGPWTLWSELPFYFPKYQAMSNIRWDVFDWHPVITLACNHWLAGCRRLIWNVLAIAPTPVCFVLMVLNILKPTVKAARIHWWGVPFLLSSLEMLPNIDSLKKKSLTTPNSTHQGSCLCLNSL